jgi:polysaccharide chain length determinant protein (PEP-CTERM system associated)
MLPGKKYSPIAILHIVWRRRWLIVTPLVVCTMVGLIVSASLTDIYQSDMLIQIVPQTVPKDIVRPTVTQRAEDRIDGVTQEVQSRTQLEQMINEFSLYPTHRQRMALEDVVELMRSSIQIDLVRSARSEPADAFHVRFTYSDPDIATKVTQRLGTLYIDRNARARVRGTEDIDAFLETKLADARRQLDAQDRKVKAFRELHAGRLPTQTEFNMEAMQSASSQAQSMAESIARDRDQKMTLEGLLSIAQSEPAPVAASPGGTGNSTDSAAALNAATPAQQLETLKGNRARAATRLKPQHPDMVKLDRAIADLEQKVRSDPGASTTTASTAPVAVTVPEAARRERLTNMRAQVASLTRQIAFKESEERRLRGTVASYQSRLEATPGVESEWQALSRDYETLQASYRAMLTKSQDAKVARDMEKDQIGEQFRVIDPARVPVRPVGPFRLQLNGIALGIGLLLGVGFAAFLELRDSSFASETDVHDVLSLPVLALVPYLSTQQEKEHARKQRLAFAASAVMFFSVSGYVFWAMKLWKHVI